jgi:hypothetical protein
MNHFETRSLMSMANLLSKAKKTVTPEQYEQFKKEFVFDKLKGLTLGQAFCEKFDIQDYMLSNLTDDSEIDFLIKALGYIK